MERAFAIAASLFSGTSLTKKASLNSLAAGVEYAARFLVAFFVTPFLIGGLGDALYGVWVVILKMTDYLSAGGRSCQALKWFVVSNQDSDDWAEKRQGVGGAIAAWFVFLPLQLTIGGVVAWYLPIWLEVAPDLFSVVRGAAFLVVSTLVLRGCVDVPLSVLIGENLGYKRIWITAPLVCMGGGLTILSLEMDMGLLGVAGAMLTTVMLTGLTYVAVVKWNVPWFGLAMPNTTTIRKFVGWSWWFTLWEFVARLMMAGDVAVLGILASPEIVAIYAVVRFLPDGVLKFLTVLVFETIPGIGKVYAAGDVSRAASMRAEVMLLTWLATTCVGATMLLWNNSFVELWVGGDYVIDSLSMFLIVAMIFQFVWIRADADFINLSLDLKRKVLIGAMSSGIALVLAGLLIRWLDNGIVGLCLGFILGRTILTIGYPLIVGRVLDVPLRRQVLGSLRPAVVTALMFALAARLGGELTADNWLSLLALAGSSGCLIAITAYFAGLCADRRASVFRRIRQITG